MNGDRQRLRGHYDEDFYWERVDRNLGWLGDTTEEQRERQARLRDAVIGIVGTGGETAREIRDMHVAASWRLFDLVLPTLLDRSYRTWDQDLSKRTYFGHPPAEASLESRV